MERFGGVRLQTFQKSLFLDHPNVHAQKSYSAGIAKRKC